MSFLDRLLPPREGDQSRAVAVLPSRFAGLGLLPGPIGPEHAPDDASVDLESMAANPASEPTPNALTRQRQPAAAVRREPPAAADSPIDVAAPLLAGEALPLPRSPARAAPSSRNGGAQAPAVAEASPRLAAREEGTTVRPPRISINAERGQRGGPAPAAPSHTSSPLSAASLAHRLARPADEPAVVHVAIGRIEVVANVVPPPAARRGTAPRQPAVALADYLRGEPGGRR